MSKFVKSEFEKDLKALMEQSNAQNDGVVATKQVAAGVVSIAKTAVSKANETKSIDERIEVLAAGLQQVVSYTEQQSAELEDRVLKLKDRMTFLQEIIDKVDRLIDEEKKSSSLVQEQEV